MKAKKTGESYSKRKRKEYNERKRTHAVQLRSIKSEHDAELCTSENDSETLFSTDEKF